MQLSPIQKFPLDLLATLQPNGGCQSLGNVDMETGGLSLGADDLHFYYIFRGLSKQSARKWCLRKSRGGKRLQRG